MSERRKYKEWFRFSSAALPEEELHVVRFSGREGLNELFSFTIDLVSKNTQLNPGKILHAAAEFSILRKRGQPPAVFRGYPTRMDQGGHFNGWTYYTIELGPACKRLTQIRQSAIFLNKDIRDTARELLTSR